MDNTHSKEHQAYGTKKTIPIKFILVVDNFGLKYVNKEDAQHLLDSIKAD